MASVRRILLLTPLIVGILICGADACGAASEIVPSAHWTFDEPDGDVALDASGRGRHARLHGATRVERGEGFAVSLDGEDDYVMFEGDAPLDATGSLTVELWIKPTRPAEKLSVLAGQDLHSYLLTLSAGNKVFWYVGGGGNGVFAEIEINAWNHVAATFGGERAVLFVNGRSAAGRELKGVKPARRTNFVMGTDRQPHLPRIRGLMDDVRVYDRALTAEQVLRHVRAESPGYGVSFVSEDVPRSPEATEFFRTHPNEIDLEKRGDGILFANRQIGLEIGVGEHGFQLNRLHGIADEQDFLAAGAPGEIFDVRMTLDPRRVGRDERWRQRGSLMGVVDEMAGDAFSVGSGAAPEIAWRHEERESETTLHLEWKQMDARDRKGVLDVVVSVTLKAGDPMSYWRFKVRNRDTRYGIERVRFPLFNLAPIGDAEENVLIYPQSRGRVVEAPFRPRDIRAYYTCELEMQFQALYNRSRRHGIYLATQQSVPCLTHLEINCSPDGIAWRPGHFPPNVTFAQRDPGEVEDDFELSYDCVAGPFTGDWYDACQVYRAWVLQQSWCRKGPLATRADVPDWYKRAPLFFYSSLNDSATGTHSLDENLRLAADDLRGWIEWAEMKLPANFYSWEQPVHGISTRDIPFHAAPSTYKFKTGRWAGMTGHNFYDGNYPAVSALREFSRVCAELREAGGMVSPYVALEIFNQGPTENAPYAAEAKHAAIRDLFGCIRTWGGDLNWQMCSWHPWWRDRLEETVELLLERENVGGLYLDVMRGSSLPCYWVAHGHTAAGGDSMATGRHELVRILREAMREKDPDAIITGENPGENMIDVIDGMLVYTLWPDTTAPLFATVYQDYMLRYGLELSVDPDDDSFFIECASLFTEGAQVGRIRLKPRSAIVSREDPAHRPLIDFLEQVVGYYRDETTQPFLSYGRLMRPLAFDEPSAMPMLEHHNGGKFPALMSGVFRTAGGHVAAFVVNASAQELGFESTVDPGRHGMAAGSGLNVDRIAPTGIRTSLHRAAAGPIALRDTLPGRSITMYHFQPAD